MTVTFESFTAVYGDNFAGLAIARFNVFLLRAQAQVALTQWGALTDYATEMKLGCLLTLSSPTVPGTPINEMGLKSINYDAELAIVYKDGSKYKNCWFCEEYDRLLGELQNPNRTNINATRGASFGGDRVYQVPIDPYQPMPFPFPHAPKW